jgi:hypothetical protein
MLGLVGVLTFWAGMWMAGWSYPSDFDWRYMTVSTLLAPSRNPIGYRWASVALASSGCCIALWAVSAARSSHLLQRVRALYALAAGSACMIWIGLVRDSVPWFRKGHELLTLIAFASLVLGILALTVQVVAARLRAARTWPRRLGFGVLIGGGILPIVFASGTQTYLFFTRPDLPWVGLAWRARGVPAYLSVALWEWVSSALLSTYLAVLCVTLARNHKIGGLEAEAPNTPVNTPALSERRAPAQVPTDPPASYHPKD